MDPQSDETGFVPAGPPAVAEVQHRSIFHRRWPKAVGAVGALTLTVALGLQFSNASHASAAPAVHVAAASKIDHAQFLPANVPADGDDSSTGSTSGESSTGGGIHGSFSLYEGAGGGLEFWFDPNTGKMTIAIGVGVGEGGNGVIGYYTPGTEPEEGMSDFADVDFGVGTVGSFSASGDYSWSNGTFSGSVSETLAGRTVTINSDGTGSFDVSVLPTEGAEGFEGAVGVKYTFSFDWNDVVKILQDIWDWLTGPTDEDLDDWYDDYYYDDGESDDVTGDDTTVDDDDDSAVTSDDDSGTTSDDGADASSDDGGDGGGDSGGGDGGGGGGGCDEEEFAAAESVAAPELVDPCEPEEPEEESYVLTVHPDLGIGYAPNAQVAAR